MASSTTLSTVQFWSDIAPFSGRIVAFTETIKKTENVFQMNSVSFAYIMPGHDEIPYPDDIKWRGCRFCRLVKEGSPNHSYYLTDPLLQKDPHSMRKITIDEIKRISAAIDEKKATFEHVADEIGGVFKAHLKEYSKTSPKNH